MEGLPRHTATVRLGELVERVVGSAYNDLQSLASSLPGQPEGDRKRELARYLHNLRQRLVRLAVLAEWAPCSVARRSPSCAATCWVSCASTTARSWTARIACSGCTPRWRGARAPLFDLPGALDVLCNGKYSALPASITDVAPKPPRGEDEPEDLDETAERLKLQRRIELEIRGRILEEASAGTLPAAMRVWSIRDGVATVGVPGEYRATLALGGPSPFLRPRPSRRTERTPPLRLRPRPRRPTAGGSSSASRSSRANESGARTASTSRAPSPSRNSKTVCSASAPPRAWRGCPPPPAPPERVEGGAQGLSGLHYVCHDAALRLAAGTIMEQSKRAARGDGTWHNGAIRTEPIKGAPGEGERTGTGEGLRMYFWLPGAASAAGAAGTRLAGVDVGSVEAKTTAAAVDAAVAAGTLPRVELTYARAVDDDSASGRIRAEALLPRPKTRPGSIASLPLDMAAVDIREVLADGVRAAAKVHLEGTLAEMTEACAAVGLRLELRDGVVARDTASRPGAEAGAEPSTTAVTTDDRGTDDVDEDEDGWGAAPRPAIVVRLTPLGTSVQLTRERRGGELTLVGARRLASSAAAESLRKSLSRGGAAGESLPVALAALARAALEHDIRAAIRARGMYPHPRRARFDARAGGPSVARRPPATGGGVARRRGAAQYVAAFVDDSGDATYAGAPAERTSMASIFVLHTRRGNPAVTPEVMAWGPTLRPGTESFSAGTKRRRSAKGVGGFGGVHRGGGGGRDGGGGAGGDGLRATSRGDLLARVAEDKVRRRARGGEGKGDREGARGDRLLLRSTRRRRGGRSARRRGANGIPRRRRYRRRRSFAVARERERRPRRVRRDSRRGELRRNGDDDGGSERDGMRRRARVPGTKRSRARGGVRGCAPRRREPRVRARTRSGVARHGGGGGDGTSVGGRGGEGWRCGAGRLGRGANAGGGDGCRADADARRGGKNVGRRRGGEGVRGGEGRGFRSLLRRARRVMR